VNEFISLFHENCGRAVFILQNTDLSRNGQVIGQLPVIGSQGNEIIGYPMINLAWQLGRVRRVTLSKNPPWRMIKPK
jgi:hypothetical protein